MNNLAQCAALVKQSEACSGTFYNGPTGWCKCVKQGFVCNQKFSQYNNNVYRLTGSEDTVANNYSLLRQGMYCSSASTRYKLPNASSLRECANIVINQPLCSDYF
eukprot:UN28952